MKRTTVTFLALAILLAHTLAVHQTPSGEFAAPYDIAHVAFRVGRNLVHSGTVSWNPLGDAGEAYPSLLWVLIAGAADALQVFPTTVAQVIGTLSSLLTIVILAQFSPKRMLGLAAPVLLACSGSVAAAGSSGTEAATAMLLVSMSFLAYERGWVRVLSGSLCLLLITRPEGVILLWALMLMEFLDRPRDGELRRKPLARAFVLPIMLVIFGLGMRQWAFGHWLSPTANAVLGFNGERLRLGFEYAASFLVSSGSAPILLLPLILLISGALRGHGRRALLLFLGWLGYVVLAGGDGLPFWNALAPSLPLAFLAVQRSLTHWLDRRPTHAPLAGALLLLALFASVLASKLPGDLGPIPLERLLTAWMKPSQASVESFPRTLGREGLLQEIQNVQRLRTTGLFFVGESQILGDARIATFWPGSLGYLSRRTVIDILGRTSPIGTQTANTWGGQPKVDLVASLARPTDYFVLDSLKEKSLTIATRFHLWLSRYDVIGDTPERFRELLAVVRQFELVSVPVPIRSADPNVLSPSPLLILRNRALKLAPEIIVELQPGSFTVRVGHHGHRQVTDVIIELKGTGAERWIMAPNGTWLFEKAAKPGDQAQPGDQVQPRDQLQAIRARANILIYDTGDRPFELLTGSLPAGFKSGSLVVHLLPPGTDLDSILQDNAKVIEINQ